MAKLSRSKKGILISSIGAICNLALASIKISIGLIAGSISVLLDGFNNFVDIFTAGASVYSFGILSKDRDSRYPQGYGRIEYIVSLIISLIIIFVGLGFFVTALERLLIPQPVGFSWIYFYIILSTVFVKIIMAEFYRKCNRAIKSITVESLMLDSYQDAFLTSFVLLSMLLSRYIGLPIDAICGLILSVTIIVCSVKLFIRSYRLLMGAVDEVVFNSLTNDLLEEDIINSISDLMINDNGHNRIYANVRATINKDSQSLEDIINHIKTIEDKILDKYNIIITIAIQGN